MQTEYFHSDEAVTVTIIVNGANVVSSFVMLFKIPWKIVVPTVTARHGVQILSEINVVVITLFVLLSLFFSTVFSLYLFFLDLRFFLYLFCFLFCSCCYVFRFSPSPVFLSLLCLFHLFLFLYLLFVLLYLILLYFFLFFFLAIPLAFRALHHLFFVSIAFFSSFSFTSFFLNSFLKKKFEKSLVYLDLSRLFVSLF